VLAQTNPLAYVMAIDIDENIIRTAKALYGNIPNLSFATGDAMNLREADASCDRVLCLEAAFHFCDRRRFLAEACRVLRPGGLLVVVDFTWTKEADRAILDDPRAKLASAIWSGTTSTPSLSIVATRRRWGFSGSGVAIGRAE